MLDDVAGKCDRSVTCELVGVREKVDQDLTQADGIDHDCGRQVVGDVDSYITRGGVVYLTLKPYQRVRLVKAQGAPLTLSKADAEAVALRQKAKERQELAPLRQAEEAAQKEEKGSFRYYFEKYGKVALVVLVGAYLAGTYIKKRA